jgi:hypothetical protein
MWLDGRSEWGLSPHQQVPQSMHIRLVEKCKTGKGGAQVALYLMDSIKFATCLSKSPLFFRISSTFLIEWITVE